MNIKLKNIVGLIIAIVLVTTIGVILKKYFPKSSSSSSNTISNHLNSEKPWITLTYSGIRISTPEELTENSYNMSEYEKSIASKMGSYSFQSKEISILVRYLRCLGSEVEYDLERGLKIPISNGVNRLGGTNLTFDTESASDDNIKIGVGTFQVGREIMEYKEIIYFNGKNEVGLVIIIGPQSDQTNQLISKIINSVEYSF